LGNQEQSKWEKCLFLISFPSSASFSYSSYLHSFINPFFLSLFPSEENFPLELLPPKHQLFLTSLIHIVCCTEHQ